jgi:hypothetical protein
MGWYSGEKGGPSVKKLVIMAILAAGLSLKVFPLTENLMAFGFGWEHFFESSAADGQRAKAYLSAPGIAFNSYGFWNKGNVGIFTGMAFLFPDKGSIDADGIRADVDLSVYDTLFQFNLTIGPGFRVNLNKNILLQFGLGLNYMQTTGSYTKYVAGYSNKIGYTMLAFNLGLGGDAGIKFDITDSFFLCTGSTLSYDFANHTAVYSSFGNASGWAGNYSMIGIRPYICIGINSWSDGSFLNGKSGFGKPK